MFEWKFNQHLQCLTQEEPFITEQHNFPVRPLMVTDEYAQAV